jgi:hypothetical protein
LSHITATTYTLLGTILLPEFRVSKNDTLTITNRHRESIKKRDTYISIKEREKKKIGVFQGMTDKDKRFLRNKGIF